MTARSAAAVLVDRWAERIGMVVEVPDRQCAGEEVGLLHHSAMERDRRRDPVDGQLGQGPIHPCDRGRSVGSVRDELPQKRIVVETHLVSLGEATVPTHSGTAWNPQCPHDARGRQEASSDVLRRDAALHGVARQSDVGLIEVERLAGCDPELPLDQVEARDQLGHRMLHL